MNDTYRKNWIRVMSPEVGKETLRTLRTLDGRLTGQLGRGTDMVRAAEREVQKAEDGLHAARTVTEELEKERRLTRDLIESLEEELGLHAPDSGTESVATAEELEDTPDEEEGRW